MKCLYSSDLHGNPWIYAKLFELAGAADVGAVLLGGDLSPLTPPLDLMIERQGSFWTEFLPPRCAELTRAGKRVLLIPGNDDLAVHDPLLRQGHEDGVWNLIDGASADLDGFVVGGCSTVSITPFLLKDREAYDLERGTKAEIDGMDLDDPNAIYTAPRPIDAISRTLLERLESLFAAIDGAQPKILMAHCPPYATALDVLYDGRHVGSRAVRAIIERHTPVLALHGHIHESPAMEGGSWMHRLGDTIAVNPGSSHHGGERARLQLVSFDTKDVAGTIRYDRL